MKTCATCLSCLITRQGGLLHRCNNPTNFARAQQKGSKLVDGRPITKPDATCNRWAERIESQNAG